ncbi:hypothetical protein KJK34_02230 [Flavobacterium sp. D11R37]|uniref:DUF5655 domain-containing protein n=1 Tax=Flavobacterium coralii TaxID=2838017 RepID=UPI001CA6AED1|nr:DUF5655 domain-containing protein [Flavobacterium coralii]MBY8961561.1 hypothetical protein [Flavobacterium coralii]
MPLYKSGSSLEHIKELPFKFEKEIQLLVEGNLQLLLKLDLIKSEFSLNNFRIDSLAFDNESKSFVIIEFKRDKNFSVIDQGYAYLSLMLNNKADFILEYNERKETPLRRNDVDWSQSKVIFISPHFTTYQKEAINFKDLPIELWEIKRFENNTISLDQVQKSSAKESIKTISRNDQVVEEVSNEVIVFTEDEHLLKADFETRELYETLKERILNLDDNITLNPRKHFVGFKVDGSTFCDIVFQSKTLKIYINLKSGELEDSKLLARDVSNVGHWGNGAYEVKMSDQDNLEYILILLKQSLKKNKG